MAAALHPAAEATNGRSAAADYHDVMLLGEGVDVVPGITTTDCESAAVPGRLRAGRGVRVLKGDAGAQVSDPDLQTAVSRGSAEDVVAGILDDQTDIAAAGEIDGGGDVLRRGGVDGIARAGADGAGAGGLAGGEVDGRAGDVDGVAQSDRALGLEDGIGPAGVNGGAFTDAVLGAGIARYGEGLGRDQLTVDGLVEGIPLRVRGPARIRWGLGGSGSAMYSTGCTEYRNVKREMPHHTRRHVRYVHIGTTGPLPLHARWRRGRAGKGARAL